jgi:hypothetical protein
MQWLMQKNICPIYKYTTQDINEDKENVAKKLFFFRIKLSTFAGVLSLL